MEKADKYLHGSIFTTSSQIKQASAQGMSTSKSALRDTNGFQPRDNTQGQRVIKHEQSLVSKLPLHTKPSFGMQGITGPQSGFGTKPTNTGMMAKAGEFSMGLKSSQPPSQNSPGLFTKITNPHSTNHLQYNQQNSQPQASNGFRNLYNQESFQPTEQKLFSAIDTMTSSSIQRDELAALKKEFQRYKMEKESELQRLIKENNDLKLENTVLKKENTSFKEKEQRKQRRREEAEIQQQYEFMLMMDQHQGSNQHQANSQDQPNVDQMTYEELLRLQDEIGFVSKGMKEEDIARIPEVRYKKLPRKEPGMCSICQQEYENNEMIKKLNPCNHSYHSGCISQWLKSEKTCPICKQQIQLR